METNMNTRMTKTLAAALLMGTLPFISLTAQADEPTKIAFVDTGNTGRSLTAEMLAQQIIDQKKLHIAVISRAVDMDPYDVKPEANAATLLKQHGINVAGHRAVQITTNDIKHSDLILTMTNKHKNRVIDAYPEAKDKTFTLAEFASGEQKDIADAWGKPMDVYKQMFADVSTYVPMVLSKEIKKAK